MEKWNFYFFFMVSTMAALAAPVMNLPHRVEKLPNGLRVYLVKYPSPGVVAFQLPVRAGSRNEVENGHTGFAHFFEHLMFRGTKKMSGKEFGELYAKLGAENNAWTWFDQTNYNGVVASRYLPKILAAEADRFQNLQFNEKEFKDEAGAVLGEYNKNIANPEFVLEEKLLELAFRKHPYGHTTMGYKEDILNFPDRYKAVWPFFRRYYRPSNVAIVLVGDVDFDGVMKLIRKEFGAWKDPSVAEVEIPQEPPQEQIRSAEIKLDKPTQTRLAMAHKVPAFSTEGIDAAVHFLVAEMAFSVTSDFQKTYRYEKKWLDAVDAFPLAMRDPGLWTVNVRFTELGEAHVGEVVQALQATFAGLREKPPSAARLSATKKRFRNAALTSWFLTPEKLASQVAWYTSFEPDIEVLNRIFDRIEQATPEHIQTWSQKWLTEKNRTQVTLKGSGK